MSVKATLIQLTSPTGSGYDGDWHFKMPRGYVYHSVELDTNLQEVSTVKKITADIGGTPLVTVTGEQLDLIDSLYQNFKKTGRFVLDFSNFNYRLPEGIYQTALATSVSDDITLTVEFGTKAAADPVTLAMKGKAWVSANDRANTVGGGRVFVPSIYELKPYVSAAGEFDWIFPSGGPNLFLQRLIFDESETQITHIKVMRGTRTIREFSRDDLDFALQRHAGVALQPGFCLLDFTLFGFGSGQTDAMQTAGLNFKIECSGPGALKTLVNGFERVAA